ncbi:transglutaminase domain-containing protein [Flavihumibacter petaseus]|uniref:DUF3857 domain-containing protein n=1 Tax=Flavihumibacter petaseus NBRC 106054 TaxID=1220578 RepID=A0A0E9N0V9_9BACT|nr:transglutaminase domain-containing protein [Flavihumibacter petaseus]GAO43647.1 hypothetical protein FPE01S_02_07530 [Flavihumibacter petaseus NBRC 106054]
MNLIRLGLCGLCLMAGIISRAQDKPSYKFGKVSPADFKMKAPAFDTGAHAIIVGDVGTCRIVGGDKGEFELEFERKIRAYILDINGVDLGKFVIEYYIGSDDKEEVSNIRGYTYNLEGGKVVETKLESSQVFTEKATKKWTLKKFTMPQLKAGSLFELSYTVSSPYIRNFRPWEFQSNYPSLWSEYNTEIPEYFDFVFLSQGYLPFHINKNESTGRTWMLSNAAGTGARSSFSVSGIANQKRWVMKDIPSIREESYTTTIENHRCKVDFQLSSINYPNQVAQPILSTWTKVSEELMESEHFGQPLDRNNGWMDDIVKTAVGNAVDPIEKAKRIYAWVRDNFTCTYHAGFYLTNAGFKDIVKTKSGNVADINLLLIALLRHEKIESYPVILSTRSHGYTNAVYPLMDRYNYVACGVIIGDKDFLLDASEPDLGFGKLPVQCYNGHARVVTKDPASIELDPNAIVERSLTMVVMQQEGKVISGRVQADMGYFESLRKRGTIREKGKETFFDGIRKEYGSEYTLQNLTIDSLKILDEPMKVSYDFQYSPEDQDVLYINPIMVDAMKENPFKSADRHYPVEIPFCIDDNYVLNFTIPDGYKVDELPKSTKVAFNEDEGLFEYLISADATTIQMRCRIQLRKAVFMPDEYNDLREFFAYVVKKQSEQIVLKKK